MTSFSGRGVRAGLLLAVACLALAGCKTTGKGMPEEEQKADDSGWVNPFEDRPFKEGQTTLPAPPQDADLIPFSVNDSADFRFAVDPKSLSVGDDRVVRYTVVITSAGGGRNVSFEGLRCDAFERRIYATLPKGATEWAVVVRHALKNVLREVLSRRLQFVKGWQLVDVAMVEVGDHFIRRGFQFHEID